MQLRLIVPAYKVAPYIYECVHRLLEQQTNSDFEVLVFNNCSPDNIRQVQDDNSSLGFCTMSRFLDATSSEYIAYLDCDDQALSVKLHQQADYLDQHRGCSFFYHEYDLFYTAISNMTFFGVLGNHNHYTAAVLTNIQAYISHENEAFFKAFNSVRERHQDYGCATSDRYLTDPFSVDVIMGMLLFKNNSSYTGQSRFILPITIDNFACRRSLAAAESDENFYDRYFKYRI